MTPILVRVGDHQAPGKDPFSGQGDDDVRLPGEPWVPGDFAVAAAIGPVGQGPVSTVPLAFKTGESSIYHGKYELTQSGYFQAVMSATQKSTGNVGTAVVTFYT